MDAHLLLFQIRASSLVRQLNRSSKSGACRDAQKMGSTQCGLNVSTLADVPDSWIDGLQAQGFQLVWLCGVWTTGPFGKEISRTDPSLTQHYADDLPDWSDADVSGSPFAVRAYVVPDEFGGPDALANFRARLRQRGMKLILDFVPNHIARDHAWADTHPQRIVQGSEGDLARAPDCFVRQNGRIFALGRDPYFPGWVDTLQLDYRRAETREAMIGELQRIAEQCDGVRCDMAMLLLNQVIQRVWGWPIDAEGEFWAHAIDSIRATRGDFLFIAEAYWLLEGRLHSLGFDFTYDKGLYDALAHRDEDAIARHLDPSRGAMLPRGVHFIENHDEPRAAAAFGDARWRHLAAVATLSLPGIAFVHDGQIEGRRRRLSNHLSRLADEPIDDAETLFYAKLLKALRDSTLGRGGCWHPIVVRAAGPGDDSHKRILSWFWEKPDRSGGDLVVLNLAERQSCARLPLNRIGIGGRIWRLTDRLSAQEYTRDGDEMWEPGLFVKLEPCEAQIFAVERADLRD